MGGSSTAFATFTAFDSTSPMEPHRSAGLPSLAETMVSAGNLNRSVPEVQAIVDKDAETRLY